MQPLDVSKVGRGTKFYEIMAVEELDLNCLYFRWQKRIKNHDRKAPGTPKVFYCR